MRSTRATYRVYERCERLGLLGAFNWEIQRTINSWDNRLSRDKVDELVVRILKECLNEPVLAEEIENELRNTFHLSEAWNHSDQWDLYRETMAVCLLQSYYDEGGD